MDMRCDLIFQVSIHYRYHQISQLLHNIVTESSQALGPLPSPQEIWADGPIGIFVGVEARLLVILYIIIYSIYIYYILYIYRHIYII